VLSDRTRTVELYFLANHQHHSGQLIAYLPKERILMYGDGYNPPAGDEIRTPERGPEFAAQLVQKVDELKLKPELIAPVHGRVVPYKNLLIAFNLDTSSKGTR
jgi:flavorubredoxin